MKKYTQTFSLGKKAFFYGFACAAIILVTLLLAFTDVFYAGPKITLIEKWREVEYGEQKQSVLQTLGDPYYEFAAGEGIPSWAYKSVPQGYHFNHELIVYYCSGNGPQLLLIFFDREGFVTFVTSTST